MKLEQGGGGGNQGDGASEEELDQGGGSHQGQGDGGGGGGDTGVRVTALDVVLDDVRLLVDPVGDPFPHHRDPATMATRGKRET